MSGRRAEAIWIESRNRWQIKVQKDGERKLFTSSIPGKRGKFEAEAKADRWLESNTFDSNMRLGEAYDSFLKDAKARRLAEGSIANYTSLGRTWIRPMLEHRKLSSLNEQDWQDVINAAATKGRAQKTLLDIRGCISAFCTYLKKRKIKTPPTEDLYISGQAPVSEKKVLQPSGLKILFSSSETHTYGGQVVQAFWIHAWRFYVLTGLRRGELAALQYADMTDVRVAISRSVNRFNHVVPVKSKRSKRAFALNDLMRQVLADQRSMLRRMGIISPWVFPSPDGDHANPNSIYDAWEVYCKHNQIDHITLHELRHTFISIGLTGIMEDPLKRVAGHTRDMDTSGVYGHEIDGELQAVSDTLQSLFSKYIK